MHDGGRCRRELSYASLVVSWVGKIRVAGATGQWAVAGMSGEIGVALLREEGGCCLGQGDEVATTPEAASHKPVQVFVAEGV